MQHINIRKSNPSSTTKNILHVFSTFNIGGTEVRTCELIKNLNEYHHTIRILKKGDTAKALLKGLSNFEIKQDNFPSNIAKAIQCAKKEIQILDPALVITYSWGAIEWLVANTLFTHKPLMHTEDGFTDELPQKQKPLRLFFRILFFRCASKLVVPAIVLKQVAIKSWFVPRKKVEFIPNGVDICHFKPKTFRSDNSTVVLGIIGTIYPVKNHLRLLRIISLIPKEINFQLWIIGSGPDQSSVKSFAEEKGITDRITFWGLRTDTNELLAAMDIFCISSDHEQMPLTVLEAMATGLPIVSTDVGDVKEMVAVENHQYIIPKMCEDLYRERLLQLILNENLRITIGEANRIKCSSSFNNELMKNRYRNLINSLTE